MIAFLNFLFKMGIFLFMFLIGAQFIIREKYIENLIYIYEPDAFEETLLRTMRVPFEGIINTFVYCMVPILNIIYVGWFVIIGLTNNENYLSHLREVSRGLKNER